MVIPKCCQDNHRGSVVISILVQQSLTRLRSSPLAQYMDVPTGPSRHVEHKEYDQ